MSFLAIISLLVSIGYIVAALAVFMRLFHPKGPHLPSVLSLVAIAIAGHSSYLYQTIFLPAEINFSLPNVLSLVCLVLTLILSLFALRFKVNLLLPVVYGFAGIWQLIMSFLPPITHVSLMINSTTTTIHIILALIAYCVLVIATLYAFQVSYINLKLKRKNLAVVNHLPPLMLVEQQLFLIMITGTVFLFLSQLSGWLFIENFISKANAHKIVLSLIALFIYCFILWGHYQKGWRGHRVQVLTLIATALLTLAYFGSRFVKEFLIN